MYAVWPFKMNVLFTAWFHQFLSPILNVFAIRPNIFLFAKTTTNSGFVNWLKNVVNFLYIPSKRVFVSTSGS